MSLELLGWSATLAAAFAPYAQDGCIAARVSLEHAGGYLLLTERGEAPGVLTGALRYASDSREDLPAVGDWVAARDHGELLTVHAVLPRHGCLLRKEAGRRAQAQVLAANVDTALLLMGLDNNYNPRRLERALALVWESGAAPAVVLTKADLCDAVEERLAEVAALAPGVPALAISAPTGAGLEAIEALLAPGRTFVLLGSSGVGKSTLLNALLGTEAMRTGAVRVTDERGRHTTTHRQLFRLPGGALPIDTPGLRELALWGGGAGVEEAFPEIEALAAQCRFADCRHEGEPGCAVQAALDSGALDPARMASYQKLQKELAYLARKTDAQAEREERDRWKRIMQDYERQVRANPGGKRYRS